MMTPVLVVILLFLVGGGRMAHARQQVESVAADAARAASLERDPDAFADAADQAARDSLGRQGVSCTELEVDVDSSDYEPGGRVRVTVHCTAKLDDVIMAGFPGSKEFTEATSVPIEVHRAW
jgi:Flp pilus assembly protein TadG